jgi:hypothetical protein
VRGACARLGLGLWIGAVAAIAFVAAPLVFGAVPAHVPTKDAAARVIGPAFARVDLFGLLAGGLVLLHLLLDAPRPGRLWRLALVALMLAAAATDASLLAPAIEARRAPLGAWHAGAVGAWMLILVAGAVLLALGPAPDRGISRRSVGTPPQGG